MAMLQVPVVGERKLSDYGQVFLAAIGGWLSTKPRLDFSKM